MKYSEWKTEAYERLKKLTDNELISLANGTEPDAKAIANEILLERRNRAGR